MTKLTVEMIEMAKTANTPEELLAMAKKNGVEMSLEEASGYIARLHPVRGELSDDDLDNVSGGADPVEDYHTCPNFVCCFCGQKKTDPQELSHLCSPNGDMPMDSVCRLCGRTVWQQGIGWVCSL